MRASFYKLRCEYLSGLFRSWLKSTRVRFGSRRNDLSCELLAYGETFFEEVCSGIMENAKCVGLIGKYCLGFLVTLGDLKIMV